LFTFFGCKIPAYGNIEILDPVFF